MLGILWGRLCFRKLVAREFQEATLRSSLSLSLWSVLFPSLEFDLQMSLLSADGMREMKSVRRTCAFGSSRGSCPRLAKSAFPAAEGAHTTPQSSPSPLRVLVKAQTRPWEWVSISGPSVEAWGWHFRLRLTDGSRGVPGAPTARAANSSWGLSVMCHPAWRTLQKTTQHNPTPECRSLGFLHGGASSSSGMAPHMPSLEHDSVSSASA